MCTYSKCIAAVDLPQGKQKIKGEFESVICVLNGHKEMITLLYLLIIY